MIKRIAILVLLSLLVWQTVPPPLPLQAAIAQTASGSQASDASDPVTMAFDANGGNLLVLGIMTRASSAREAGAPTYNAVGMTDSPEGDVSDAREASVEIWYLVSPAAGSNTISVPNSGTEGLVLIVTAWSGVDVADPFDTSDSDFSTASTADPSVTFTTGAADKLIIDMMGSGHFDVPSANTHTLIAAVDNGNDMCAAQYTLNDGSGGITLGYTVPADDWAMIVASFNPSGVAPPTRRIFIID